MFHANNILAPSRRIILVGFVLYSGVILNHMVYVVSLLGGGLGGRGVSTILALLHYILTFCPAFKGAPATGKADPMAMAMVHAVGP